MLTEHKKWGTLVQSDIEVSIKCLLNNAIFLDFDMLMFEPAFNDFINAKLPRGFHSSIVFLDILEFFAVRFKLHSEIFLKIFPHLALELMQIPPEAPIEFVEKSIRLLSILVNNEDNAEAVLQFSPNKIDAETTQLFKFDKKVIRGSSLFIRAMKFALERNDAWGVVLRLFVTCARKTSPTSGVRNLLLKMACTDSRFGYEMVCLRILLKVHFDPEPEILKKAVEVGVGKILFYGDESSLMEMISIFKLCFQTDSESVFQHVILSIVVSTAGIWKHNAYNENIVNELKSLCLSAKPSRHWAFVNCWKSQFGQFTNFE